MSVVIPAKNKVSAKSKERGPKSYENKKKMYHIDVDLNKNIGLLRTVNGKRDSGLSTVDPSPRIDMNS